MKIPRRSPVRSVTDRVGRASNHAAPATRPIRGSINNPIRPRRRRPWIIPTDEKGNPTGPERMAD